MKHREKIYEIGERVGQIIILLYPKMEIQEINELFETAREEKGFGGSGGEIVGFVKSY